MIKVRKEGVTLLIFTSMKFRLLGKGDQHVQILHEFLQSLPWESCISEVNTHMTVSHQLATTNINLHKLDYRDFSVEMELCPAAKLRHCGLSECECLQQWESGDYRGARSGSCRTIGATSDPCPRSINK